MLTSKDRAKLRGILSTENSVYQIGKDGLTDAGLTGIREALKAREAIKITILQNSQEQPKEVATKISDMLKCEVVGIVGRKIMVYKINPNSKNHIL